MSFSSGMGSNDPELPLLGLLESFSLDDTLGAVLVSTFCGLILYGISVHQLYRYIRHFPSDDRFVQLIVFVVMISETVHCIATMHLSYFLLVSDIVKLLGFLSHGVWSLNAILISSAPIAFVSQLFFARRVSLLGPKYRLIVGIASLVLLSELAFAGTLIYKSFTNALANDSGGIRWLITTELSLLFATDLLFTPTLIVALRRSRAGLTQYVLDESFAEHFVTYFINTGLLHCMVNAAAFITCVTTSPSSMVYYIPQTISARLYANTLLSALNSRDPNKAPTIFDSGTYDRNLIQRMNRRAAADTWNVPQVQDVDEPPVIHINVTTEDEGTRVDPEYKFTFKRGKSFITW